MEINTQLSGTMVILLLLIFTPPTQACYYEGDPVWTGNAYDNPPAAHDDISCFYSGDPVMISAGHYDNPSFFADNSYYTADEQEATTHAKDTSNDSEFSAFENQEETDIQLKQKNRTNQNSNTDTNNWTPGAWDMNY